METGQISAATQASQATQMLSNPSTADMGKAEFLQLLVAQLQNQDPLSPMQQEDFAAQLAQFSSLEQLTDINTNLKSGMDLDAMLSSSLNNSMAAGFIGKEVSSIGDTVALVSGETPSVNFILQDNAAEVTVKIYDESGNLVRTIEHGGMTSGAQSVTWDGLDQDGVPLKGGNYRFEVSAKNGDDDVQVQELTKGIVSSVRYAEGKAVLIVNGREISLGDVLEIG